MRQASMRINEIDFFRGIAIILMVYFHLIYDLKEFYNHPLVYTEGFNYIIGRIAAILFILITGISCAFSKNNLKRALHILLFAYLITIVTYHYSSVNYINFGILHFLGFSILLFELFRPLQPLFLVLLGTAALILGFVFKQINVANGYLYPLGLLTPYYQSLDYYPLFPYLGFFLYGIAIKKILYPNNKSYFPQLILINSPINKIGRNSLLIYILHQPVLLGLLYIMHSVFNM